MYESCFILLCGYPPVDFVRKKLQQVRKKLQLYEKSFKCNCSKHPSKPLLVRPRALSTGSVKRFLKIFKMVEKGAREDFGG